MSRPHDAPASPCSARHATRAHAELGALGAHQRVDRRGRLAASADRRGSYGAARVVAVEARARSWRRARCSRQRAERRAPSFGLTSDASARAGVRGSVARRRRSGRASPRSPATVRTCGVHCDAGLRSTTEPLACVTSSSRMVASRCALARVVAGRPSMSSRRTCEAGRGLDVAAEPAAEAALADAARRATRRSSFCSNWSPFAGSSRK